MTFVEFTVPGAPRQKKNSGRIAYFGAKCRTCRKGQRPTVLPAQPWQEWADSVVPLLSALNFRTITHPVNCRATFFADTKRKVDACNLYEGLADILEAARIVEDDALLASWDGSRVELDRENPRVEVVLEVSA